MDSRRRKQAKIAGDHHHYNYNNNNNSCCSEEVNSIEWEFIMMSEQEEDLVYRMHKLVGDRWGLIAGRIPGRKPEEIERFWVMRHTEGFPAKTKTKTEYFSPATLPTSRPARRTSPSSS
ncbi:MYB-like transcription factor ETC3 [Impatiens glandulifera]|uniref:MYB-like transcription factor ETC3 n=1 Tax=Impatiens glandulifera TaxID=253017 RepID=UPI001FB13481|nr:MYB-like transcription factor ETC3 [Impatiens glandulifera]